MAAQQGANGLLTTCLSETAVGPTAAADEGSDLMAGGVTGFTAGRQAMGSRQERRLSAEALLQPILSELAELRSLLVEVSRCTKISSPICCACTHCASASDANPNASTAPGNAIAVEQETAIAANTTASQDKELKSHSAACSDAAAMISRDADSSCKASTVAFELSETPRARLQHQQGTLLVLTPQSSTALTPAGAICSPRDFVVGLPETSALEIVNVCGHKESAANGIPCLTKPNSIVPLPGHPQQLATGLQSRGARGVMKTSKLTWNPRLRSLFVLRKAFNAIRCESLRAALSCDSSRKRDGCNDSWASATTPGHDQGSVNATCNMTNMSYNVSPAPAHVESPWLSPGPPSPNGAPPLGEVLVAASNRDPLSI